MNKTIYIFRNSRHAMNLYPTISVHETKQKNNPSTKRFTNFDNLMSEKELFNHK